MTMMIIITTDKNVMFCRFLYYRAMKSRDRVFTSMLERLLNGYKYVPSLRPVNLRDMDMDMDMDMDSTENILTANLPSRGCTTTRTGGSKVVFGRLVEIRDQEYIIVSQSDNYRIIHYMKHSLDIIKRYEQGITLSKNEVIGVPQLIVDEIYLYASRHGSLENIKRRFNRVLCDLNSSESEADKLWPYRHELSVRIE